VRENRHHDDPAADTPRKVLDDTDLAIVLHTARGLNNDAIAAHIQVSKPTIAIRLRHMYERLQVTNRTQLVAYAYVHRLLHNEQWPPQLHE
jgi:DNA-binding NarL/FixJ family response regulator